MTLPSAGEVRIIDTQQIYLVDINPVCARTFADAVLVEVAVADQYRRPWLAAEDTVLIVDKLDTVDCQIALDQADTRSVTVGHTGACQGQVPHRRVITPNDKKPHSVTGLVCDDNAGAGAFDHEVVSPPHRAVEILSRLDLNMIAPLGNRGRCRWSLVSLARTDFERAATARTGDCNSRQHQHSKPQFRYAHFGDPRLQANAMTPGGARASELVSLIPGEASSYVDHWH